jgi:hypothetical protein
MLFQPLEQRSGEVQYQRKELALRQTLQDRPIDILDVLLEDIVEVPDGLVQVQPKYEPDRSHD